MVQTEKSEDGVKDKVRGRYRRGCERTVWARTSMGGAAVALQSCWVLRIVKSRGSSNREELVNCS